MIPIISIVWFVCLCIFRFAVYVWCFVVCVFKTNKKASIIVAMQVLEPAMLGRGTFSLPGGQEGRGWQDRHEGVGQSHGLEREWPICFLDASGRARVREVDPRTPTHAFMHHHLPEATSETAKQQKWGKIICTLYNGRMWRLRLLDARKRGEAELADASLFMSLYVIVCRVWLVYCLFILFVFCLVVCCCVCRLMSVFVNVSL